MAAGACRDGDRPAARPARAPAAGLRRARPARGMGRARAAARRPPIGRAPPRDVRRLSRRRRSRWRRLMTRLDAGPALAVPARARGPRRRRAGPPRRPRNRSPRSCIADRARRRDARSSATSSRPCSTSTSCRAAGRDPRGRAARRPSASGSAAPEAQIRATVVTEGGAVGLTLMLLGNERRCARRPARLPPAARPLDLLGAHRRRGRARDAAHRARRVRGLLPGHRHELPARPAAMDARADRALPAVAGS